MVNLLIDSPRKAVKGVPFIQPPHPPQRDDNNRISPPRRRYINTYNISHSVWVVILGTYVYPETYEAALEDGMYGVLGREMGYCD